MEFRISADEVKKALYRAQGIVESKVTMPILANILITATKAGITVTAFDLDIGIVSEHPAEVVKPGALTVNLKYLTSIVQNLPDAQVTFKKLASNYVDISSGSAHFKLVGMAAEDFPRLPKEESAPMVQCNGAILLEMVRKALIGVSYDETRYALNGAFFEPLKGATVALTSTDGHRLSTVQRELGEGFGLKRGVILPRKALQELKRLLDEAPEAECHLGFAENSALFKKPGLTMVLRLVEGNFPEYQRVIPEEKGRTKVVVPRVRLLETLKRIALMSADKSNAVRVGLSDNALTITATNPDLGEARDSLEVASPGASLSVGFNARYLTDVLGVLEVEEVALEFGDAHAPVVLHAPGDRSYIGVVMPMRI